MFWRFLQDVSLRVVYLASALGILFRIETGCKIGRDASGPARLLAQKPSTARWPNLGPGGLQAGTWRSKRQKRACSFRGPRNPHQLHKVAIEVLTLTMDASFVALLLIDFVPSL